MRKKDETMTQIDNLDDDLSCLFDGEPAPFYNHTMADAEAARAIAQSHTESCKQQLPRS